MQPLPNPLAPNAPPAPSSWLRRMATGASWTWRRAVPFARWGDRVAQQLAPADRPVDGLIHQLAAAWLDAAGPARQAELRLNERLGRGPRNEDVRQRLARQLEDIEALERVLDAEGADLPPDDPLAPYEPLAAHIPDLQRTHREHVALFCSRASLHASMAAVTAMWLNSYPQLSMADLTVCMRSAIAGLARWDGWHAGVEAGLVPSSEEGLASRVEALFMGMLQEKGMGWVARMQARGMLRMLGPIMGHMLPRLGNRVLENLHRLGEESHLRDFLGATRQGIELLAHHLQQVVRIQRWADAGHAFLDERTGAEEDGCPERDRLLQRELQKGTYHHGIDWQAAIEWCNRYIADQWGSQLFGFSESLASWMRLSPSSLDAAQAPAGVEIIWNLFRKALFYLRLPLIAACVLILRMVETAILNPLARQVVFRALQSGRVIERATEAILNAIRPAPELQVEGSQATFRGYFYPIDAGLRQLYRTVRQLIIAQRDRPEPDVTSLQRLRDGSRLRLQLDEGLQGTAAEMTGNLLELIRQMPSAISRAQRLILAGAKGWSRLPSIGAEAVARLMTLLMHDPLLRQQPAEVFVQRLDRLYSLDPEPSLAEKREMHNLQRLSRRWMLRELKHYIEGEVSNQILGQERRGLLRELSFLHLNLLEGLPAIPEAFHDRRPWLQEVQRVVQNWEIRSRELSLVDQIEVEFGNGAKEAQAFTEIDRIVRRLQVVLRFLKIGEAGAAAEEPLRRQQTQDLSGLEKWLRSFSDRVGQTRVLLERLLRHTTVGERETLDQDLAALERVQGALTATGMRLRAQAEEERQARGTYPMWNTWRRSWEGALRAIREQQRVVDRAEGSQREEAVRSLENLWWRHHRSLSQMPPPCHLDRWETFRRGSWRQAWSTAEAEEILDWGRENEAQAADRLEELALRRRQEGQIAQGLELLLRGILRSAAMEGAEQPRAEAVQSVRQVGDLALAIAEGQMERGSFCFAQLERYVEELGQRVEPDLERGLEAEALLSRQIEDLEQVRQSMESWFRVVQEIPHFGPRWRAPESWRRLAQELSQWAATFYQPDLEGEGPAALDAWRSLLVAREAVETALQAAQAALQGSLQNLQVPAREQALQLLAARLGNPDRSWAWQEAQREVQHSIGFLIRRLKQLAPSCAPPPPRGAIVGRVMNWGAKCGTKVMGLESMGDHLVETLISPGHIQGVIHELVTRVGRAYATAQGVNPSGPTHRALRDGGAVLA